VGAEPRIDGRTYRDKKIKVIVVFRNFAKAPKKEPLNHWYSDLQGKLTRYGKGTLLTRSSSEDHIEV
jgi:hypothetical protein